MKRREKSCLFFFIMSVFLIFVISSLLPCHSRPVIFRSSSFLVIPRLFSLSSFSCFFSLSSFPGLTGESKDPRNALRLPEDDKEKILSFPDLTGESLDCRIKSGNDSGRRGLTGESIRERSPERAAPEDDASLDARAKPEHDRKNEQDRKKKRMAKRTMLSSRSLFVQNFWHIVCI